MAAAMKPWLAPRIEHELKEAVEWKQRTIRGQDDKTTVDNNTTVRDFSSTDFSTLFKDDGSSLSIRYCGPRDRALVVQVLDISPNLKCRLSDGYTFIKARLTPEAKQSLFEHDGTDTKDLLVGCLLSINEFQIRATTLGKIEERVQLHVRHATVYSKMRHGQFGRPEDISEKPGIKKIMGDLQSISKEDIEERAGPSSSYPSSQILSRGHALGTQRTNVESQSFLTQAAAVPRRPMQTPGAVNVAAPVAPNRTASGLGSTHVKGRDGFRTPFDMLQNLQGFDNAKGAWPYGGFGAGLSQGGRAASQHVPAFSTSNRRDPETIDLVSDEEGTKATEHDALMEDLPLLEEQPRSPSSVRSVEPEDRAPHDTVDGGTPQLHDVNQVDTDILKSNKNKMSAHDQVLKDDGVQPDVQVDAEPAPFPRHVREASQEALAPVKPESNSLEPMPSSPRTRQKSPTVSCPSSYPTQGLSWHGITRLRRSHCIVPQDQQELLNRKESWNPPAPGTRFPMPNIPRALLEQFERQSLAQVEARRRQDLADPHAPSRPTSRDEPSSQELESSPSPTSLPPEQQFEWPASSPGAGHLNELPPDSSVPKRSPLRRHDKDRDVLMEDEAFSNSPGHHHLRRSIETESSPRQHKSTFSPKYKPFIHGSVRTPDLLSSAVNVGRMDSQNNNAVLLQPSTLSQSDFRSPVKVRSTSRSSSMDARARRSLSRGSPKTITSSYVPGFRSAQVPQTPIFFDGAHSRIPSAPTSDADRAAEEQLQGEFKASAEKISGGQPPSPKTNVFSSPLSRTQRGSSRANMDVGSATPLQILGKRVPSSPRAANDRPRKSRFGFSQEAPVAWDPAPDALAERRRFLAKRKQGMEERIRKEEARQANDHHSPESATFKSQRQRDVATPEPETVISSSPPVRIVMNSQVHPSRMGQIELKPMSREEEPHHRPRSRSPTPQVEVDTALALEEQEVRPRFQSPVRGAEIKQPLTQELLYREFSSVYADYKGNLKHFTNLLREVDHNRNSLHQFLWDDYIIRSRTDYAPYNMECVDSGETSMSYFTYYTKRITKPKYIQGVLTPYKLEILFEAQVTRPRSSHRSPTRNRNRENQDDPGHIRPQGDRYVPLPHSSVAGSLVPSTVGALHPRKPRSSVMMSFAPGPVKKASSEQKSNAFARSNALTASTPRKPQQQVPSSTARPASTADANARRPLPWGSRDQQGRSENGPTPSGRMSSASNGRQGSNSEFHFLDFFDSYRELMSVKGGENSDMGKPRRINVLAWNLDPTIKAE